MLPIRNLFIDSYLMDVIVDESSDEDPDTLSEQSDGMSDASEETVDNEVDDPDYNPNGAVMDDTEENTESQPQASPNETQPSASSAVSNTVEVAKPETDIPDEAKEITIVASQRGSDDDGQCCTICFEPWTSSSEHRLVSLRCGHLFGRSCITRWLKGQNTRCPQCNSRARRSEIRNIYAKAIKVIDSSERDKALQDLARETELRRAAEMNAAQERIRHMLATQECERLKRELIEAQKQLQVNRAGFKAAGYSQYLISKLPPFSLVHSIEIARNGGCRIVDSSNLLGMLLVSQPSSNVLFQGYGFRKVSTHDMKASEFVLVHQKPIRDMSFHPNDGLVLTASLDKTLKITNILSNTVVHTYNVPSDVWSCVWNSENSMYFYGGLKTGEALVFDIRMTRSHVHELPKYGANTPVVSLQYLHQPSIDSSRSSGPMVGKLSDSVLYQKTHVGTEEYKVIPLPSLGPFTCLSSISSGNFLVSCRPSPKKPRITHTLCNFMTTSSGELACIPFRTVEGGRTQIQLTRSKLLDHPDVESSSLVCAGDEDATGVLVWDGSSGGQIANMKTDNPVLDLSGLKVNHKSFLTALTNKSLLVYGWNGCN